MINTVVLVGRTTKDIDLRYAPTGTAVANFTLAVTRRFNREEADFIRCVAFKKTAELIAEYVKKGHQVGVEGTIQTGSYDKDGQRIYTTDVIVNNVQFLEPRDKVSNQGGQSPQSNQQQQQQPTNDPFQNDGKQVDISDDDLPF